MADITQCRDIKKLNPLAQVLLNLALKEIKDKGVNPLIVETYRSKERQLYLYGQGRTAAQCKAKGVPVKYADPKKSTVTWTINSIHIQKNAVDLVPQRKINGKMTAIWNLQDKEFQTIIKTMQKYGFEAGAFFKPQKDGPHYQIKGVSANGKAFYKGNTNPYITKMVQAQLNKKVKAGLTIDGYWGEKTTQGVNKFRKKHWKLVNGKLGETALKELMS